jgi:iron complex transport system substrate-binding protein
MLRQFFSSFFLYLSCGTFILGWWTLAWMEKPAYPLSQQATFIDHSLTLRTSDLFPFLASLNRLTLQEALGGRFDLMLKLIEEWDLDAQVLTEKGMKGVQRLSNESYLQAQLLAKLIESYPDDQRVKINNQLRSRLILDDNGKQIDLTHPLQQFFPQTYVAASFLLAIANPKQIKGIPKGLRALPHLYSTKLLQQIPTDLDNLQGEKLYLAKPDIAFISHYSHPNTLQVLQSQGIQLYAIKNIDTLADIQKILLKIGHLCNRPIEAQLLHLFIEASLMMLDNRLSALYTFHHLPSSVKPVKSVLYLYHQQHYMMPTTKCLTGQLWKRALQYHPGIICPLSEDPYLWRLPFNQEKIVNFDADCLIISTPSLEAYKNQILYSFALKQLKSFHFKHLFYIDETVQESPTQYIVLAYFDIFQALAATYLLS